MLNFKLTCSGCKKEYSINTKIWKCTCGSPLDVTYSIDFSKRYFEKIKDRTYTVWRYHEMLPVDKKSIVSLGEGCAPIIKRKFQKINLYLKIDYLNPTGSFKDRGSTVLISFLKRLGVKEIVEDSSGNAGASIAAYSSAAGMKCSIYVPEKAPHPKIMQIKSYNAEIVKVSGDRSRVHEEALKASKKSFYAGHLWNPLFIEGLKTLSYEIYEHGISVDAVVVPIGSGGNAIGIYKGFRDLLEMDAITSMPRIYGVQAVGYAPIYEALYREYRTEKVDEPFADGIAVPDPPRKNQIARIIRETEGDVVLVNNYQILQALRKLAKWGFFVEPTSATVLAATEYLIDSGMLDSHEKILLPLTGFGFKALDKIEKISENYYNKES